MNDSTAKSNHLELSVVNLYYPPDQSATAQLLGQWCEALSHTFDLTLTCGSPTYDPNGVRPRTPLKLNEIALFSRSRTSLFFRILNYALFTFGALFKNLFSKAPDAYVCWTDPPWNFWMGAILKTIKRKPLMLVVQDLYPEVLFAFNPKFPFKHLLKKIFMIPLELADHLVVIGEDMKKVLLEKGISSEKITVIPNWHNDALLFPSDQNLRKQMQIPPNTFVVMHAGNLGVSQHFEALLQSARTLETHKDILFILVGNGAKQKELEQQTKYMPNVRLYPYVPQENLNVLLNTADVHYVSLKTEFTGLIVPSKLYGILSVGKPVVALVEPTSQTHQTIQEANCGWLCDRENLSQMILQAKKNPEKRTQHGQNGLKWFKQNATLNQATQKYTKLFHTLLPSPRP